MNRWGRATDAIDGIIDTTDTDIKEVIESAKNLLAATSGRTQTMVRTAIHLTHRRACTFMGTPDVFRAWMGGVFELVREMYVNGAVPYDQFLRLIDSYQSAVISLLTNEISEAQRRLSR